MSSTISAFEPTSTTFTTDDGSDPGDSGGMSRGANYFFGFLITFVVLLLIFVGCGIGSRRRFLARRQAMLTGQLEPWMPNTPGGELRKPILYEKPLVFAEDDWTSIQPLSLQAIRRSQLDSDHKAFDDGASSSASSPRTSTLIEPRPARRLSSLLPSLAFLRRSQDTPSNVNDEEKQIVHDVPEAVQVAVVVLMPSPPVDRRLSPHHWNDDGSEKLPEYQLGIARIPWYSEIATHHDARRSTPSLA